MDVTNVLNDIGDPGAPVGSPAWCKYAHIGLRENKHRTDSECSSLKWGLRSFKQDERYKQLTDRVGKQFKSWDQYVEYPEPWGLGMPADIAQTVIEERDERRLVGDLLGRGQKLAADPEVKALANEEQTKAIGREGGKKGGRGHKNPVDNIKGVSKGGTGAIYLVRRLKRDAPDIAKALARGEYPSVRAAAIAAGILTPPTTLEKILKLLPKLTATERRQLRARLDEAMRKRAA